MKHGDGSTSTRLLQAAPVPLAAADGPVVLKFYAVGLRDAVDVHVQIAAQEVPLLYAGKSGSFDGLDEVSVLVPRSLASRGDTEVVVTADGQTAAAVHVQIQ
jgi:uncharacterized protein (TIGR03437 family)